MEMVLETDENGGYQKTRVARVKRLLAEHSEAVWLNQYDNEDNPCFHYATTGEEVAAVEADVVAGSVSTGGHLCGIARRIKEKRPQTTVLACDIEGSAVFGGTFHSYLVNGAGLSWRSKNIDLTVLDKVCMVADEEAISACRIFARETGLLMGGSGGLVLCGALTWLKQSAARSAIAIIPDTGANYMEQIYNNDWIKNKGIALLDKSQLNSRLLSKAVIDAELFNEEGLATSAAGRAAAIGDPR
jgi:cysteine synthase